MLFTAAGTRRSKIWSIPNVNSLKIIVIYAMAWLMASTRRITFLYAGEGTDDCECVGCPKIIDTEATEPCMNRSECNFDIYR